MVCCGQTLAMDEVRQSIPLDIRLLILFSRLEVRLPRNWLGLVEQVAWNYEEETIETILGRAIRAAAEVVASTLTIHHPDQATAQQLKESLCGELDGPDTSIPLELLSPVASREPSPRRIRPKSKSPARWKIVRSINDAIQNVLKERNAELFRTILDQDDMSDI